MILALKLDLLGISNGFFKLFSEIAEVLFLQQLKKMNNLALICIVLNCEL